METDLLVTGSSGQIGSYLVDHAMARGLRVRGLDLRPSRWTTTVGDVCDLQECLRSVKGCTAVVHCAAQISVQASLSDPAYDAHQNIIGTLTLLQAAAQAGVRRFVHVSSAAVYGVPQELPLRENHPSRPSSPYGLSKLATEGYVRMASIRRGMEATIVRPFNVYSPRQDPANPYTGVMSQFAARIVAGKGPLIYGDGTQSRDFVHSSEIAGWLLELAVQRRAPPEGPINLGTGVETTIEALARAFCEVSGTDVVPEYAPARAGEIHRSVADTTLAGSLGLSSSLALVDGIRDLVDSARRADAGGPEARGPTPSDMQRHAK